MSAPGRFQALRPEPLGGKLSPVNARARGAAPGNAGVGARGFTLIEVMVALAITAVALTAGLRAAAALTDNADRLQQVLQAQWCADNQLTQLRLARTLPDVGETEFACEQLGRRYAGRLRTRATPNPAFRRVDAVVSDLEGRVLVTLSAVLTRG